MQMSKKGVTVRGRPSALRRLPLAAAIYLAFGPMAFAQQQAAQQPQDKDQADAPTLGTVVVTAQKREENLQKVPISIQAIGNDQLEQQQVADFDDYAKLIPSLSYATVGGGVFSGPGFVQVYMRGVASGGDGNHSGSQPSVGTYLDEQPITSASGALDIHMYDINRVEALAGPQGTLYGASSQSGTLRIITNKPDPTRFASGYAVELSGTDGGGISHVLEGFANLPVNENVAVRLVGWEKHDAGYVDNVRAPRTFPSSGIVQDNASRVEDDYNDADIFGARAALLVELNDNWTITPQVMAQKMVASGSTGFDPGVGDLKVSHAYPESSKDRWTQAALTIQGKIGNFDLTYAYSHLNRDIDSEADYSDYGFWYDTLLGLGAYFYDDDNVLVNPSQYIQAIDRYRKTSHELRIASPAEDRLRIVAGLFWQEQKHDIEQRYRVDGLASSLSVSGWEDTIWLTEQDRADQDKAVFGEVTFDITPQLAITGGARYYRARNGLKGYFGFSEGFLSQSDDPPEQRYGEAGCRARYGDPANWQPYEGAPCNLFDKEIRESGTLGKLNLTYEINDTKLVYATWSEGYRPGGINRRGTLPPYLSDVLTNYEIGWKTSWANNRVTFNGAIFREDWEDFQFSYLGLNGLTEIRNANQARINGIEVDLNWAATYNLTLSGGMAWYDAELTEDYCAQSGPDGRPAPECYLPDTDLDRALAGTRLPVTPEFKGNLTARYAWDVRGYEAYFQAAAFHQGDRSVDLRQAQGQLFGTLDAYSTLDLSMGFRKAGWTFDVFLKNVFDERAELARFAECNISVCGNQPYTVVARPRTLGIRFSREF